MFTPRITLNWRMTKPPPLDLSLNKVSIEISFSGIHKEALPKRFPKKTVPLSSPLPRLPLFFLFFEFDPF